MEKSSYNLLSQKQQQQQTQHITTKLNNNMTNNMNNKTNTDINNGRTRKSNHFSKTSMDNKPRRRRRRATSTFFSTLHPILKRSKKEPILPTFEKKSTNQLRRYDDVNTILHSEVHEIPLSTLIWMDQLVPGEAAMKLVKV
jgi:hypothetical protein